MSVLRNVILFILIVTLLPAQTPSQPKVTHVLAILSVTPGITREQINPVMQEEVQNTLKLYLAGKIDQWWARSDGKGVVFLMNCSTVEEARETLEALPLAQHHLASFEYMALTPLTPLRLLIPPTSH